MGKTTNTLKSWNLRLLIVDCTGPLRLRPPQADDGGRGLRNLLVLA